MSGDCVLVSTVTLGPWREVANLGVLLYKLIRLLAVGGNVLIADKKSLITRGAKPENRAGVL